MRLSDYAKRYWPHAMVSALIGGGISYLAFRLLLDLSAEASAANGLVMSLWGIILSLVGFAITLYQVKKTQSSALAATNAVNELKGRIAAYDSAVEVQKATVLVQETQRHIRVPSWESANATYKGVRESILRLTELSPLLSAQEKDDLSAMLVDISNVSDKIDGGLLKGEVALDRGRALRACRQHEDSLIKLSISLQRKAQ